MIRKSGGQVFWHLKRGDTLSGVAQQAFHLKDVRVIAAKTQELLKRNPHIKNPDRILAGSLLALGPADGVDSSSVHSSDLEEMQRTFGSSMAGADYLTNNWEFFHGLSSLDDSTTQSCRVPVSMSPHDLSRALGPAIGAVATQPFFTFGSRDAYRILKAAQKTTLQAAQGKLGMLKNSKDVWRTIEGELVRGLENDLRYVRQTNGVLGFIPKGARALMVNGKAIVVNPSVGGGLQSFSRTVRMADKVAALTKPVGHIFKAIDFGLYVKDVHEAMGTSDQNRKISKATGKYGVGLALAPLSVPAAAGICSFLTFTTGVGGVVCFVTMTVAISYSTSKFGEKVGEVIYESVSPIPINPSH